MSLRSCDHLSDTFQSMFNDKQFLMARQRASYIIQDGMSSPLENDLCRSLSKAESAFILMYGETTTIQSKCQIDALVRFVVKTHTSS